MDSMQVYRRMDIGTAKPNRLQRRNIRHHMIDIVEPSQEFTVAEFRRAGRKVIDRAGAPLVIAGGSGLHFRSLVDPMNFAPTDSGLRMRLESAPLSSLIAELIDHDPDAGSVIDLANGRRVVRAVEVFRLTGETPSARMASAESSDLRRYVSEVDFRGFGLDPGELVDSRIDDRLRSMRRGGLVDEVRMLQPTLGRTASRAVGYREVLRHLDGESDLNEAFEEIAKSTRNLARRQRTWFQRDPRIQWIPWVDDPSKSARRIVDSLT